MNTKRLFLLLLFLIPSILPSRALALPDSQWNALVEVTHKFAWYPQMDLQDLFKKKGEEYGQPLREYRALLLDDLTTGSREALRIDVKTIIPGKPWKDYLRLALTEFDLFLVTDKEHHLENARAVVSVLSGRIDQGEIRFWTIFFDAYDALFKGDRDAFVDRVFRLWQDVLLRTEIEDILMESEIAKAGFVRDLPYLYENLIHLVVSRAIVEKRMADLHPLSVVILDLKDKLSLEQGYRGMVAQIVERMQGPNSDNCNLNFAVAYLEATANRYEFEDEKDERFLPRRFRKTTEFYDLAIAWADSSQGKGAMLTEYMGFMNYVIRRFAYRDDVLTSESLFGNLPYAADEKVEQSIALYDALALPAVREGGFVDQGFANRNDYLKTMHGLWDSTGKLSIVLYDYFKALRTPEDVKNIFPAERPLLRYIALFQRHAVANLDIVPDNAYFLTSVVASDLAELYREVSTYSTGQHIKDQYLAYQVQAIELFPFDVGGVLQLAYQMVQEGRVENYFRQAEPMARRLERSEVPTKWLQSNTTEYNDIIPLLSESLPSVMRNAFSLVNSIKGSERSEDALFRKAILMGSLLKSRGKGISPSAADALLSAMGGADFSVQGFDPAQLIRELLPSLNGAFPASVKGIAEAYPYFRMKNELYGSLTGPLHVFLRDLFYETPPAERQYVQLTNAATAQ